MEDTERDGPATVPILGRVTLTIPRRALPELNARLEGSTPREIVRWALEDSGLGRVAVAASFQAESTAILHMVSTVRPETPVLFLETGFHFAETLEFKERLTGMLGLNVVELRGELTVEEQEAELGPRLYERDPARCCAIHKVRPLQRALGDHDAWITGLRRDSAPTRSEAPILDPYTTDEAHEMLKINPVVAWSRREVWRYLKENDLPHHPLYDLGYASIGCAPCTRALFPGEDERAGRWAGVDKVECGIHLAGGR